MPYSPKHKLDTREKILESARRLFNRKGFSEVSIDEVMENAGLTRGGFYRHFRDKDELYAEAPLVPLHRRAQALATQAIPCSDGEKATRPACH
jgi:TetR/AcrR family transcriptional regulator, transcriptional repressor for nem operon